MPDHHQHPPSGSGASRYHDHMPRFEDVAKTFWERGTTHLVLPPLTDDLVAATESGLNVTLPEALLMLLRLQNGGLIDNAWNRFPTAPNSYAHDHVPFTFMHGIGPPVPPGNVLSPITLLDTPYLVQEWGLPTPVVLLYGEGHYWIALDYRACRNDGEPCVTWLDSDRESEALLAPDFRTFVEGLTPETDF
jgi:hypothetical protein